MMGCKKCSKLCSILLLVLGVLFLLQDLGVWTFWNINWWSVLFILFGLGGVAKGSCPECQAMCSGSSPKKK